MPQVLSCELLPVPGGDKVVVIIIGILECIIPAGVGLLIASLINNCSKDLLVTGLCQLLFTFIILGALWSFVNGIYIIIKSV